MKFVLSDFFDNFLLIGLIFALVSCGDPYRAPLPPKDKVNFPIGLSVHPSGDYLYAVNSNFRATYRPAFGGTLSVIDTKDREIEQDYTPYLPSFAGDIELNGNATKAYVAIRRGNAIAVMDVGPSGRAVACRRAKQNREADPNKCLINRVPGSTGDSSLPSDPYGLDVSTIERSNSNGEAELTDVVAVSHLRGNRASILSLPDQRFSAASFSTAPIIEASNAVARRPGTLQFYAPARLSNQIAVFAPYLNESGRVEAVLNEGRFSIMSRSGRMDARAIEFTEQGNTAYVATRSPSSLYILDVEDTSDGTEHRIVSTIPTAEGPSDLAIRRTNNGDRLIYLAAHQGEMLQVIDPDLGAVIDEISLEASPSEITFNPKVCDGDNSAGCHGYISLFDDPPDGKNRCEDREDSICGSIAVINLNPNSDDYHQIIDKIR